MTRSSSIGGVNHSVFVGDEASLVDTTGEDGHFLIRAIVEPTVAREDGVDDDGGGRDADDPDCLSPTTTSSR